MGSTQYVWRPLPFILRAQLDQDHGLWTRCLSPAHGARLVARTRNLGATRVQDAGRIVQSDVHSSRSCEWNRLDSGLYRTLQVRPVLRGGLRQPAHPGGSPRLGGVFRQQWISRAESTQRLREGTV